MSAKIVVINKCMDCPVDMCENRQVCGGIPPECELEDAQRILRFRCQVCDVVYLELPEAGAKVSAGQPCGIIEAVKSAEDLISPLSGTVEEKNQDAEDSTEIINESPYEDGWLFRCQVCGGYFEHTGILFVRYYCPYCGSYAVNIIKQTQKEKSDGK